MTVIERDDAAIYTEFRDKVAGYVRSRVTNRADAEDLVQAVFLKVYGGLDKYDEKKASLSTWIYTVTRNTVYDYLRQKQRHPTLELVDGTPDAGEAPEETVVNDESLEELAAALERLPQEQRDAVILLYYHGLDRKTVAEKMGITYGQLRYLHDKALARLGTLLKSK